MNFRVNITASKIYAFTGVLFGFSLAVIYNDPDIFVNVFVSGAALFGAKMGKEAFDKREQRKQKTR